MPIRRNIPPGADVLPDTESRHAEIRVIDLVLMNVQKNEKLRGVRIFNLGELFKGGSEGSNCRGTQFGRAINAKAHIITSPAELIQLHSSSCFNRRAVRRTVIDRQRRIVREK